ncbi:MAG: glycosyltransferase family 4 protein [candidate division WOR-3 bacterium]
MNSARHICLLTSSYPADYSRFLDREAKSLYQAGFQVTLIGLGNESGADDFNGIKVIRVRKRHNLFKFRTLTEIARLAIAENADVYHCIDPWCLMIGLKIKKFRTEVRIIYESSEWFPRQYLDRIDLPRPVRLFCWLIISYLEYIACRRAEAIIETNQMRAQRFIRRKANLQIIPNYPPLTALKMLTSRRKPWVMYTGLICRPRGFDRLLTALVQVKSKYPDIKLIVRGEFDPHDDIEEWTNNYIRQHGLQDNIQFVPRISSYEKIFELLQNGLCGVILFQPRRGNDWTNQPNKLFEFMSAGIAVIASNFPEIASIINNSRCGWLIDPTSPEEIAQALERVMADPEDAIRRGMAGRRWVESSYNWGIAERSLLDIYQQVTG